MAFDTSALWNYDSTTFLLLSVIILLYTFRSYIQPVPLAHPILLGRQSDIAKVRQPLETSTYRNYGVGHGAPLPARPRKDILVATDTIQPDMIHERSLWGTKITNTVLKKRIQSLANGLIRSVGLVPEKSTGIILLDDSFEWLLIDLALASIGAASIAPTRLSLLSPILEQNHPADVIFTDVALLEMILEQVAELGNHFPIVIVGPGASQKAEASRNTGFNVMAFEELEAVGKEVDEPTTVERKPDRHMTTSFYDEVDGVPVGVRLTHENLTAGPTSIRSFFTLTTPLAPSSTILSAFPLASAFGRAIAYTAVFEGCNFATLDSTSIVKNMQNPTPQNLGEIVRAAASENLGQPTHLFITPSHLESITNTITAHNKSTILGGLAWARKENELAGGTISNTTIWDEYGGLADARRSSFGYSKTDPWLKAVVVAGAPCDEKTFPTSRLALSVPLINAHIEPISTAALFASHPFDLQHFHPSRPEEEVAHVGAPGANIEVKITGEKESDIDGIAKDPLGKLFYRGPSIGQPVLQNPATSQGISANQWVDSGRKALIHSNGTFRILQ
ncbi:acetyl-CoA synthetase-like protein [Clavulina sp. PMI_390]|nr:acetyl-CoA synthetase-like protein [Clavulina sp. PMI_390]